MLAVYTISLALSAGVVAVYAKTVAGDLGLFAGLETQFRVVAGVAAIYVAAQTGYLFLVKIFAPTRERAPLWTEALSHLAALALIPYILKVNIAWPHPILYKVAPLVFLGVFLVLHVFFKLMTFFAALQAAPSGRLGQLGWAAVSVVFAVGGLRGLDALAAETHSSLPVAPAETEICRVGDVYADARPVPEAAVLRRPLVSNGKLCLTMLWGSGPEAEAEPEQIYIKARLEGNESSAFSQNLEITPERWTELRVPPEYFPSGARTCDIMWLTEPEPRWARVTGLRPLTTSGGTCLLAGPFIHEVRTESSPPNLIVIAVEGLAANHLSSMGYRRETTPSIDRLGERGLTFSEAYTPVPEADAGVVAAFMGASPLRLGCYGNRLDKLPATWTTLQDALQQAHYATAAFTEGEEGADALFEAGHGRGFDVFDPAAPVRVAAEGAWGEPDSAVTLEKARSWIDAHRDLKFMVFVRLRELSRFRTREAYSPGFLGKDGRATHLDTYDSALRYLDLHLGALFKHVRDAKDLKDTCIVVLGTHGYDFSAGKENAPTVGLIEDSLRSPIIISGPRIEPAQRMDIVSLLDVAPTLAELAGVAMDGVEGRSLLRPRETATAISAFGDPVALSIRSDKWRCSWQTAIEPFTGRKIGAEEAVGLYDIGRLREKGATDNESKRYPEVTEHYLNVLGVYLRTHGQSWREN